MEGAHVRTTDKPAGVQSIKLDSAVLSRLLKEVQNNVVSAPTAYNRQHNRHNR
jgi:soluble lytic murein transglycosylase-like protein